jgi:hypothetical protein
MHNNERKWSVLVPHVLVTRWVNGPCTEVQVFFRQHALVDVDTCPGQSAVRGQHSRVLAIDLYKSCSCWVKTRLVGINDDVAGVDVLQGKDLFPNDADHPMQSGSLRVFSTL